MKAPFVGIDDEPAETFISYSREDSEMSVIFGDGRRHPCPMWRLRPTAALATFTCRSGTSVGADRQLGRADPVEWFPRGTVRLARVSAFAERVDRLLDKE